VGAFLGLEAIYGNGHYFDAQVIVPRVWSSPEAQGAQE
jgi:hypothetical protein